MGLNTVSVYLFWNEIEPTEGNFVFQDKTTLAGVKNMVETPLKPIQPFWSAAAPTPPGRGN